MNHQKFSFSKDKIKVVLLEGVHDKAAGIFHDHGYTNINLLPASLSGAELEKVIKDAFILGIRSRTMITPEVLQHAKKLVAIGCFCIGTNQVDLDATTLAGIPVFNAPHSNTRSVAELVIGLAIMLFRGTFQKSTAAHRGVWLKAAKGSYEMRGKTIGIIGYGHIGSQVSILAEALGMRVIYYDIKTKLPLGNAKPTDNLNTLLKEADIITLHVPENDSTKDLISARQLKLLSKNALLINTSRGSVVDIDALATALKNGAIKGAAVDVFPSEPKSKNEQFDSPLQNLDNVILTPHVGGSTIEAQENIAVEVAKKLIYFSDRGSTEGAINFPSLHLTDNIDAHRILHIHHNIPGILQQINTCIAEKSINVSGQYLLTNNQIGYAVIDIEKTASKTLSGALKQIKGTIRTRTLY